MYELCPSFRDISRPYDDSSCPRIDAIRATIKRIIYRGTLTIINDPILRILAIAAIGIGSIRIPSCEVAYSTQHGMTIHTELRDKSGSMYHVPGFV